MPRKKAIGILKISNIYIHSSYPGGGLSTSLLEAMLCGCSVIATPNEGADEIIQNEINGILIKDNHKDTIKKAIEKIINFKENKFNSFSKLIHFLLMLRHQFQY